MNDIQIKQVHKAKDPSAVASHEPYVTSFVTSRDGTRINYRQLGHGPGVVMLHGAMESAQSHMQLAEGLADLFTVHLPERCGHNLGFPFVKEYGIQKEVEDLAALLTKTDTHNVFGVSSGGLICLQAALISGMIGAQLGSPAFNRMPRWLLELFTTLTMKQEDKNAKDGDVTMRALASTLHYDFQLVAEMAETLNNFRAIHAEVLLLGGSKSPAWLKTALDALASALPHVQRVEFPGLDHGGSSDISSTNRFGKPDIVAPELQRFFAEPSRS